ncbi:Fatty-acid amide hydrolase 2, partial [Branchiostoma belcheri]
LKPRYRLWGSVKGILANEVHSSTVTETHGASLSPFSAPLRVLGFKALSGARKWHVSQMDRVSFSGGCMQMRDLSGKFSTVGWRNGRTKAHTLRLSWLLLAAVMVRTVLAAERSERGQNQVHSLEHSDTRRLFDENCPQQTSAPPARGVIFTATDAVLAGFSECAYEALQFLLHEEHMPEDSELVVSLRSHLRNSQMSLDVHRVLQTHLPHPTFDSAPPQRLMTPPRHAVDMPLPPSPHTMQSPSQPTASRSELAMPATPQPPVPTTYPNSPAVVHSFSPAKLPSSPGVQISLQQQAAVRVPNSPGAQLGMQHRLTPPCTTPNSTMSLPNVTPLTVAMATSTVARVTASAAMATSSPSPGPVMPIFAYLPPRSYGYGMPTPPPPPPPQYANGPPVSPYQPVFVGWLPPPPQPPPQ